jgi:hypothetical protein
MKDNQKHLQDLKEIRSLMEKSSKFVSLSGLSGVITGCIALLGAGLAYMRLKKYWILLDNGRFTDYSSFIRATVPTSIGWSPLVFDLVVIALGVLFFSLVISTILTLKTAKKNNQSIWDKTTQLLFINMIIPLAAGGVLCLLLIKQKLFGLVAPMTLIFYGLALVNASKYTIHDIRYLGLIQITLGLVNASAIGYGIFFWALGFGVFHIIYGVVMYFKYERKLSN